MTRPPAVSVPATESAVLAYALVRKSGANLAVVHRGGEPVSIVDAHRLHRAALRTLLADADTPDSTVASCLPQRCVRIPADAPLSAAAAALLRSPVPAALVYRGSTFIGVLAADDVLTALAPHGVHAGPASGAMAGR
jgi:signal-transduction protein with cAMP-binding, CBS, and nucleotidyltransferase domain